jgi:hypothetical protein
MRLVEHVARMVKMRTAYNILFGNLNGRDQSEVLGIAGK